ncbi:Glycosyltransferase involved in cell wall bisynthesis [Pedobacter westerhofensis]|uniref:Glycosyltransferase involved in cell wall bisynthesis n=1 Tax=Pedobacter westerhofensis TaxID=425512 RepID=A0A521C8C0_9SPHI|nr:glycosyltransferase [Pedobacter westerhofensis]SMO55737.1 Glycosyltransferase involved in cell wall bisynthesis [Pedobacter westerhofensis]
MKVAIVHDELMRRGGAEQVVLTMLKAYPDADIYTLAYNPEGTYPEYKQHKEKIHTSSMQILSKTVKWMQRLYFPSAIWAMKSLDVQGYDVVIVSNTHSAKYVNIDKNSLIFIYTYTPFRLAWNPTSYSQYNNSKGAFRWVFNRVISYLRKVDKEAAQKGNYFLGMTEETVQRIKDAYSIKDVKIIPPDVKCRNFHVSTKPKDYFLLVSRLEYYKKADLAIEVFNKLGLKLIVVGNGSKAKELKALAKDNIEFKSGLSSDELSDLYANCKALIFPQYEDYGITPLEANASGRPVIAFGVGGVLETMIPYTTISIKSTAIFFHEQTVESLSEAVLQFELLDFDPNFIRKHAEKFDEGIFVKRLREFVNEKYSKMKKGKSVTIKLNLDEGYKLEKPAANHR